MRAARKGLLETMPPCMAWGGLYPSIVSRKESQMLTGSKLSEICGLSIRPFAELPSGMVVVPVALVILAMYLLFVIRKPLCQRLGYNDGHIKIRTLFLTIVLSSSSDERSAGSSTAPRMSARSRCRSRRLEGRREIRPGELPARVRPPPDRRLGGTKG